MLQNPSKKGHFSQIRSISKSRTPTSSTPREGLAPQYLMKNHENDGQMESSKPKQISKSRFLSDPKMAYLASKNGLKENYYKSQKRKFSWGAIDIFLYLFISFSFQVPCQTFWSVHPLLMCPPPVGTVSLSC